MQELLRKVTLFRSSGEVEVQDGFRGIRAGDRFAVDDNPGVIYVAETDARLGSTRHYEVISRVEELPWGKCQDPVSEQGVGDGPFAFGVDQVCQCDKPKESYDIGNQIWRCPTCGLYCKAPSKLES